MSEPAPPKKVLTRDDLLTPRPRPPVAVDVPGLGGMVYVRRISTKEADAFEASRLIEGKNGESKIDYHNARGALVAQFVCDENGKPLFSADDAEQLGDLLGPEDAEVIAAAAMEANGMGAAARKKAKKLLDDPRRYLRHVLVVALGWRSLEALARGMSRAELAEWEAFHEICPLGPDRGDLQAAVVAMCSQAPWREKGATVSLDDYLLDFGGRRRAKKGRAGAAGGRELSVTESRAVMKAAAEGRAGRGGKHGTEPGGTVDCLG